MTSTTDLGVTLDEKHRYFVNGVQKPGVGEILSRVGVKNNEGYWRSLGGSEFMEPYENARTFGRALHEYIRMRLAPPGMRRNDIGYDPQQEPWIEGWEMFWRDHPGMRPILVEVPLYSRSLDYCGTPDCAVEWNGQNILLDWKSGALNPIYFIKTAAYVRLLRENVGQRFWHVWLVEIQKKTYHIDKIRPGHIELWLNKWISCLNTYRLGG